MEFTSSPAEHALSVVVSKSDAVKMASSVRNYGQRFRFREAPLSFIRHISLSAGVILTALGSVSGDDDRDACLRILNFFCGVLNYMSEVHVYAATLLESLRQQINAAMLRPSTRGRASSSSWDRRALHLMDDTHVTEDWNLWPWAAKESGESYRQSSPKPAPELLRSPVGRPKIERSISTPDGNNLLQPDMGDVTRPSTASAYSINLEREAKSIPKAKDKG